MKTKHQEDIVISGISGRYPESNCIDEFSFNLYNKVNMITDDDRRYPKVFNDCPMSSGKLKNAELFDADFFNVNEYEANHMDAQIRCMLETTYEAICDSGTLPEALSASNTGVFIGQYIDEGMVAFRDFTQLPAYKNFMSQTIANKLNLLGPTFSVDAACASSLVALYEAFLAVRKGVCDKAIVIGVNIVFNPGIQYNFFKLNMISPNSKCMCLDEKANGYAKGEACVTIVVERESSAKRIYTKLVNIKSNNDGYKEEGITFPNWRRQNTVISNTYFECSLNPKQIDYMEAHCTGTKAGDPAEMKAIYHSMIEGKERESPLLIGALKSNIGHTEGASGLCAITKVILSFENQLIPGNLHFERANPNIESLIKGYLKPINENTEFNGDYVGVNNFGFGGSNCHAILKSPKIRPKADNEVIADRYQRLVVMCGRNQECVQYFFDKLFERPEKITKDLLHLINNLSKANPFKTNNGCQPMRYRGFALINQTSNSVLKFSKTKIKKVSENPKEICFIFNGFDSNCKSIAKQIIKFEIILKSLQNSSLILQNIGIDLMKILEQKKESTVETIVCLVALEIALFDSLKQLNVCPNHIIGYSTGEIVSAYADSCITREQALLIAYNCGKFAEEVKENKEFNSKINKLKKEDLNKFFDEYFEEVVSNQEMSSKIQELLNEFDLILKTDKIQTNKWITNNESTEYVCSQYFVKSLLFPMTYRNKLHLIPKNSIIVEVSVDCLLEKEIPKYGSNFTYIPLMKRNSNNFDVFLSSFGKLYSEGINVKIEKLYAPVTEPVSNGTRILSPLIKWDHSKTYRLIKYPEFFNFFSSKEDQSYTIDFMDSNDLFIKDHCIDGKVLVPATAYLLFAWKSLAFYKKIPYKRFAVEFTDVRILRATPIPNSGKVKLHTNFDECTGRFDIIDSGTVVVTGKVFEISSKEFQFKEVFNEIKAKEDSKEKLVFNSKDIYKTLRIRGYNYGPNFRCIQESHLIQNQYISANIQWNDNFVTFSDSLLQTTILGIKTKQLLVPVQIDLIRCDPNILFNRNQKPYEVIFDPNLGIAVTQGMELRGLRASPLQRNINATKPVLFSYEFNAFNFEFKYEQEQTFLIYQKICDKLCENIIQNKKGFSLNLFESQIMDQIPEESKILYKTLLDFEDNKSEDKVCLLDTDLMNGYFSDKNFLRSQLTIVMENRSQLNANKNFEICEINDSSILLYLPVMNVLQYIFNIEYSLIQTTIQKDNNNYSNIKRFVLKNSCVGQEIASSDLIIFKDQSLCQKQSDYDLNTLFESFSLKLKSNAFLMILVKDKQNFSQSFLRKRFNLKKFEMRKDFVISEALKHGLQLVSDINDCFSNHSLLLRKISQEFKVEKQIFINFNNNYNNWFEDLRKQFKQIEEKAEDINIWLISKGSFDGILGFVKCLKSEPNGHRVRCLQIINEKNNDLSEELKEIIKRDLVINVIKDDTIGHYVLNEMSSKPEMVKTKHCFMNLKNRGDLSSFEWFESKHKFLTQSLVHIYYCALNFRDIMLATGRLQTDPPSGDLECLICSEFSAKDENMNRVMGMVASRALATTCVINNNGFLWPIPDHWTLEEAATVPCVYATAYYALIIRGKLKPNEKVLIHSGSGGVGQAAIRICLSLNCQLFITVGTEIKKQFLKKLFPQLKEENFSSSRDLSFKTNILKQTNGFGVDLVLNSLSDEKLFASLECLANNGRFLEIGKYDMTKDSTLNISELLKNKTFHSIQLDTIVFTDKNSSIGMIKDKQRIWEVISDGIKKGVVVPLNTTVFDKERVEEAFRFMSSGKHMGKVLIKIRDEEKNNQSFESMELLAIPRTVFHSNKSYIITGGLGGMGLEIIEWMIERGAKKFVITSRTGPKDSYQKEKLLYFGSVGIEIRIWTQNIIELNQTKSLLQESQSMGPIGGIFHLSLVLSDGLFENQSIESFDKVFNPKSNPLFNLDLMSRDLDLDYFVVFSSGVSSVGHCGQSNYGFTNSIMERIIEQRKQKGLKAQAIEWGPVGDVGYVTENITEQDLVVNYLRSQRIFSCLQVLDRFLQSEVTICSSMVFNDLNRKSETFGSKKSLLEKVCHILGQKREFSSFESKTRLSELGMDSLMSVEIKQTIERDFDLILSTQEIQNLTIDQIRQIETQNNGKPIKETQKTLNEWIFEKPKEEFKYLNEIKGGKHLFYLPPTDGTYDLFIPIAIKINRPVIGLNWTEDCLKYGSVVEMAEHFLDLIEKRFKSLDFDLIGYSYGVFIALEMSSILEKKFNKSPELIALDMCPIQARNDYLMSSGQEMFTGDLELNLLFSFLMDKIQLEIQDFSNILSKVPKTQRIQRISEYFIEKSQTKCGLNEVMFAIESHVKKMTQMIVYEFDPNNKLLGNVLLLRAKEHLIRSELHIIAPDYGFNEIINGKCFVHTLDGNHTKFMANNSEKIAFYINSYFK